MRYYYGYGAFAFLRDVMTVIFALVMFVIAGIIYLINELVNIIMKPEVLPYVILVLLIVVVTIIGVVLWTREDENGYAKRLTEEERECAERWIEECERKCWSTQERK